ncbi:hypothetical protein NQ315_010463 [Exocentrus adspersus]|uniref:Gustatory receptor n=1 Tax=Exocentrus adspersus TaxID=1586481 RepID=A0AAV8W546_9CUCU|nr:hypothetical protein NQ315_010463 [Exocentrus adspersus]
MDLAGLEFDLRSIYSLMRLSEKLGITPPLQENGNAKCRKYYPFVVTIVIIIGCWVVLYGTITCLWALFTTTNIILGIFFDCCRSLGVLNRKTWKTFLDLFTYIDKKLNKHLIITCKKNLIQRQLLLCHFFIFFVFGYDIYICYANNGWKHFRYTLFKYFGYYHATITALVLMHFAAALSVRFKRINNILTKSSNLHGVISNFVPKYATGGLNNLKSIKEVSDYYLLLSELVDMFNKLFGWQIFLMTENIIAVLLEIFNSLMLAIDYTQKTSDAHHDFRTILVLTSLVLIFILAQSKIILHCEDVNNESRNTLTISYKLQQTVEPSSDERNELVILGDVVNLLNTKTCAAGFYCVNRSLLSRVFSTVISYSIVLIQFNKQK